MMRFQTYIDENKDKLKDEQYQILIIKSNTTKLNWYK